MTTWSRKQDERGSAAIEAVVGVPAFVLFVGLIIFGGRTATTHAAVEAAAADAARTASIARSSSEAKQEAVAAAEASLANQDIHCLNVQVVVDVGTSASPSERPARSRQPSNASSTWLTCRCRGCREVAW
ncbi:TadE/TadG family type IV pilus assembly protein [Nocardioides sambongensis]|uniref:TadE/TadG family type IV pilus assembly protein n=1 Tax=Nocardioides sambongensis TaxID=2589074 RepID=UPI001E568F5B|nr:TadE/TadG family type IV pilus assembly protein [Nocardioides sambongensis]